MTEPPFNHPSVVGVYLYRGQTVPLIDLKAYLGLPLGEDVERSVVVVTEFNEMASAFITDRVNRIHRLKWSDLKPMDPFLVKFSPQMLGTVQMEDREMLVLDLEQIIGELFPQSVVNYAEQKFQDRPVLEKRSGATVVLCRGLLCYPVPVAEGLKNPGIFQGPVLRARQSGPGGYPGP